MQNRLTYQKMVTRGTFNISLFGRFDIETVAQAMVSVWGGAICLSNQWKLDRGFGKWFKKQSMTASEIATSLLYSRQKIVCDKSSMFEFAVLIKE